MKLMVSLLLLAVISQAYAGKKTTKSKKTAKSEKSEDSNYGERTESRGHNSREEENDSSEDLSYRPHIYSPYHYGKIPDVLAEGHYHDAIASQLYSPLSPYQHRFGVPGYEISAPIPSELAYSAHEIHRPISSKKYKKKGQSKHSYHEEDLAKDFHYPHSYPHFPNYPHDYSALRTLYPHGPHHLYPERALISPHLYPGVSPLVRPIVPPVLGPHVIPQVGLSHPLAYANGAIPYGHGYVQPLQYIQQHSVEQVIPGVSFGQENQGQDQESQRDANAQTASSGVVGQQAALQQLQQHQAQQQQFQQQQLQPQQFQQQTIPTQQQYQPQLLIQPQQVQQQQVQPQQLQNVQLQPQQTQGAVSYASFSQSLPSNYPQNQAYGQPQTQSTQTVSSQFSQNQIYQPQPQAQRESQSLFQSESSTQQSQQEQLKFQPLRNFLTTPSPQPITTARTIAPGYLPVKDNQELKEEASQSLIQIQTTEPPYLQSYNDFSSVQQTTSRPEPTVQPISQPQQTQAPSQLNFRPQTSTTSSPQTNHQQSSNDLSNIDKDELLQELSHDQPTIYSQEVVIQQPGIPGADIQYFGDYTGSLLRGYQNS